MCRRRRHSDDIHRATLWPLFMPNSAAVYHQNVKVKPESCHASGACDLGRACCSRCGLCCILIPGSARLNSLELWPSRLITTGSKPRLVLHKPGFDYQASRRKDIAGGRFLRAGFASKGRPTVLPRLWSAARPTMRRSRAKERTVAVMCSRLRGLWAMFLKSQLTIYRKFTFPFEATTSSVGR